MNAEQLLWQAHLAALLHHQMAALPQQALKVTQQELDRSQMFLVVTHQRHPLVLPVLPQSRGTPHVAPPLPAGLAEPSSPP